MSEFQDLKDLEIDQMYMNRVSFIDCIDNIPIFNWTNGRILSGTLVQIIMPIH
jgi:hypothetical protein